jgi:hypothetical protein
MSIRKRTTKYPVLRRLLVWLIAAVVTVVTTAVEAPGAAAFGIVEGPLGQSSEHEEITRASLHCPNKATLASNGCFQSQSLDKLAGKRHRVGAIGYPDTVETFTAAAHCDDADFLDAPHYPHPESAARAAIVNCVRHLRGTFHAALAAADGLVDAHNKVVPAALPRPSAACVVFRTPNKSVKCQVIIGFGRALHGVQDFYAHSNYTDRAHKPFSATNPPGLELPAPAGLLNLVPSPAEPVPASPDNLTTGCYRLRDTTKGSWGCRHRITHYSLNHDKGTINPITGAASHPKTPRGCGPMTDHSAMKCGVGAAAGTNFAAAVHGAIVDTRRQWADFKAQLITKYGTKRGTTMACVITHDQPLTDCVPAALLYKAVIDRTETCTGECNSTPGSHHNAQESETFTIVADVPLTTLPVDATDPAATGDGTVKGSTFPGAVNTGTASDVYTNVDSPFCNAPYDGTYTSTLTRIAAGIFTDATVAAHGPAEGPPTTMDVAFTIEDDAAIPDPSVADVWHDVWNNQSTDPLCTGTSELTQNHRMIIFMLRAMHAAFGEQFDNIRVTGLPVTPEATDRVYAGRHKVWTDHSSGGGDVLDLTVTEDIQIVTDDSCDATGLPPAPLVDCTPPTHAASAGALAASTTRHSRQSTSGQVAAIIAAVRTWHRHFITARKPTCAGLTTAGQHELAAITGSHTCTQSARRLRGVFHRRDKTAFKHVTIHTAAVHVTGSHAVLAANAIHYHPKPTPFLRLTAPLTLTHKGGQWLIDSVVQHSD